MTDVAAWIDDHIYVPILAGVVLVTVFMFICCSCYRRRRMTRGQAYVYKRLEHEAEVAEQMNRERETQQNIVRDAVFMSCQYYLRSHANYKNLQPLKDLGSRIDKHWFLVMDVKTNVEYMLSCMAFNSKMSVPFTLNTAKTMKHLFSLLQHPHIYPTLDFDFSLEQNMVFVFQPVALRGSLKDVIYQSRYADNWYQKYSQRRRGLSLSNIKTYGKQVLMGLLYLKEKGFPPHGNIHAGNVIFVEGVCRVTGYENRFLANTSRVYTLVRKKLKEHPDALDTLCFGHLLYEMAFGFELASAHPEPQQLIGHQDPATVEILNFIFEKENGGYPTIEEIANHPFFERLVLSELKRYNPAKIHLSEAMKTMLKAVKKGKPLKPAKPSKRKQSSKGSNGTSASSSQDKLQSQASSSTGGASTSSAPPPPPPPPPSGAPPPPPPPSVSLPPSSSGRSALLGDIRKGTNLKKAKTNDRSAPRV